MTDKYPDSLLRNYAHIVECISVVGGVQDDIHEFLEVLEDKNGGEGGNAIITQMVRLCRNYMADVETAFCDIVEYCRAADVDYCQRMNCAGDVSPPHG